MIAKELKYKYLLSLEGNDVSSSLKWMLYSNSVVFMRNPRIVSWIMEDHLEPYIHYIPLNDDFNNNENIFGSKFTPKKLFKKIILDAKNGKIGTEKCILNHPVGNIYRATKNKFTTNLGNKLLYYARSLSPSSLKNDLGGLTRSHVERITKSN